MLEWAYGMGEGFCTTPVQRVVLLNNVVILNSYSNIIFPEGEGTFFGEPMNRIVHIALKVDNLERTTQFYEKVFRFKESKTEKVRDHTSRHLSDGAIDLSIMQYDAATESTESKAAGEGPCIHHFAVEVDDLKQAEKEVRAFGCKIISDPGVIPVKFRAPGGTVCEIVPKGRYKKSARK